MKFRKNSIDISRTLGKVNSRLNRLILLQTRTRQHRPMNHRPHPMINKQQHGRMRMIIRRCRHTVRKICAEIARETVSPVTELDFEGLDCGETDALGRVDFSEGTREEF